MSYALKMPPDSPRLSVDIRCCSGTFDIDVSFELRQPWTLLFGPSGSGKSTILRAIAGLVRPDAGKILQKVDSTHGLGLALFQSSQNICMPAYRRWIPLAPQAAHLLPHKRIFDNVAFGIREKSDPRHEQIPSLLSKLRIAHLADQYPGTLSGGEAQRVNLARAIIAATEWDIVLLDEPFTGLDIGLRSELLLDLKAWVAERNLCVFSVTHDVAEAFQLGAEVIKIADGKVVAQGPVEVVLADERARLLAQLNGAAGSPA